MDQEKTTAAFILGYEEGKVLGGDELSYREAEGLHPELDPSEVRSFCNGFTDGIMGDSWRYDRLRDYERAIGYSEEACDTCRYFYYWDEPGTGEKWPACKNRHNPFSNGFECPLRAEIDEKAIQD